MQVASVIGILLLILLLLRIWELVLEAVSHHCCRVVRFLCFVILHGVPLFHMFSHGFCSTRLCLALEFVFRSGRELLKIVVALFLLLNTRTYFSKESVRQETSPAIARTQILKHYAKSLLRWEGKPATCCFRNGHCFAAMIEML
eukprot:643397-Amphidinium_carterae.1